MASTNEADNRPLSPHIMNWKWPVTMASSIFHRVSGVALYVGSFVITALIVSAALGPEAYATVEGLVFSIPGKLLMFAFTAAVVYHLLSGVRHMIWDGPRAGFSPSVASTWSWFNIVATAIITSGIWAYGIWGAGA